MILRVLMVLFVVQLLGNGCSREPVSYAEKGIMKGPDLRLCACCGGVILETENGTTYQVESLPGMKKEDFYKLPFPINIAFNRKPDRECAGLVYIKITSYKFY